MIQNKREFDHYFQEAEPGRKGEILEAAMSVFDEFGYDGGSMRQIASRVGVRESALYRHFPGKEAILAALLRVVGARAREEALAVLECIDAGDLRGSLLTVLRDRRRSVELYGPLLRLILPAATRDPTLVVEFQAHVFAPAIPVMQAKVAQIDAACGVPDAEKTRGARMRALASLFAGYLVSSMVLGDDQDDAIVDAALRVMWWEECPA